MSSIFSFTNVLVSTSSEEKLSKTIERYDLLAKDKIEKVSSEIEIQVEEIKKKSTQADASLEEALKGIRQAAAEGGITPQSQYFKEEAEIHIRYSRYWLLFSIAIFVILIFYISLSPLLSMVFPVYDFSKTDIYKSINLITSKMLIFASIAYLLFLSVKNFNAHRHNAIVNKHRQNALLTYSAIVSATKDDRHKDAVLNHAASCIFSPQESGYAKSDTNKGSLVEIIPKMSITPS